MSAGPAELDALAAELGRIGCDARVLTPPARRPCLHAASAAARQAGYIYAGDGWYWQGWAARITGTAGVAGAARAVVAALRPAGSP